MPLAVVFHCRSRNEPRLIRHTTVLLLRAGKVLLQRPGLLVLTQQAVGLLYREFSLSLCFLIVRNGGITLTDALISMADVAIDRTMDIYLASLTEGLLEKHPLSGTED